MFTPAQQAAVVKAFSLAGYNGLLKTAPVTSDDERIFVLPPADLAALSDRLGLEQALQELLQRKVWIVGESESWQAIERFR
jgi:hypothetical protein